MTTHTGSPQNLAEVRGVFDRWLTAVQTRNLDGVTDGHDDDMRGQADLLLGFGLATWPHMLVRAMLAEQLYRATAIIAGHPYHRD